MRISTDPHLALQRKSHTTKASRAALADAIHGNALHSVTAGKPKAKVCVGDLFDTYSNSEADILKAAKVAKHYDVVLAGNHDSLNVADSVSSLDLLAEMLPDTSFLINPDFASHHVEYGELEGMALAFVPHHGSQELFDAALASMDYKAGESAFSAVFLHCNYENGHTQGMDTSLNLTKVQAEKLLTICDYIFLGHEHQPRQLLDGRLIICGCTHPTSFSDISDKYYYDLTKDWLEATLIWSVGTSYQEIDFNAEGVLPELNATTTIVDIKGEITADKGVQLAEAIKHYWQHPGVLMIRNSVRIVSEDHQVIETVDFDKLPEVIAEQLKGGDLEETYEYYRGLVQC